MVYAWQLVSVNHIVQVNTWFAHGLRMFYKKQLMFTHVDSIVSNDLSMIRMFTLFLGILT